MATFTGSTTTARSSTTSRGMRTTPKQFLTWSAAAANHRFQKLSKHLVNNVSKLQNKMEKALHHPNISHSRSSSAHSNGGFCDDGPFTYAQKQQEAVNTKRRSNTISTSSSANLVANMASNDSEMGITSKCKLTPQILNFSSSLGRRRKHVRGRIDMSDNKRCSVSSSDESNNNSPTELNSCRTLGDKPPLMKKCLDMVNDEDEMELRPVVATSSSAAVIQIATKHNLSNSSSNNTSMSSNVSAGTTIPLMSPQWSRAGSVSTLSNSSCSRTAHCDNNNIINEQLQRLQDLDQGDEATKLIGVHSSLSCSHPLEDMGSNEGTDKICLVNNNSSSSPNQRSASNNSSNSRHKSLNNKESPSSLRKNTNKNNNHRNKQPSNNPLATSTPTSKLAVTIFEEEEELRHAPWFQAGIPREIALEVLRNEPIGSFIVRESTTKAGCFALSLRVPREFQPMGIAHYLILRTGRGYKIKGFTKEFGSLSSLITHHSVMAELLPCPLSLARYLPKHTLRVSRINSSDFVEPEKLISSCGKFTDF